MPMKVSDEWLFNKLETISTNVVVLNQKVDGIEQRMVAYEGKVIAQNGNGEECFVIPKKKLFKYGGIATGGGTLLIIAIEIVMDVVKMYIGG